MCFCTVAQAARVIVGKKETRHVLTCDRTGIHYVHDTATACLARRMATVALTSMHLERVTGYIKRFDKHGNIHEK